MAAYLSVPLAMAAALLQTAVPQTGPLSGLKPDLVLVMVAMAGLLLTFRQGLVLTVLAGLVLDLFSGMPPGFITLALLAVLALMRLPNRDSVEMNPLLCMALIALVTALYYSMYGIAVSALGGPPDWLYVASNVMLPSVVMNTLLSPFVFVLYRVIGRRRLAVREDWRR